MVLNVLVPSYWRSNLYFLITICGSIGLSRCSATLAELLGDLPGISCYSTNMCILVVRPWQPCFHFEVLVSALGKRSNLSIPGVYFGVIAISSTGGGSCILSSFECSSSHGELSHYGSVPQSRGSTCAHLVCRSSMWLWNSRCYCDSMENHTHALGYH